MRTQANLSLEVSTAEELRALAEEVGAPIGELADLFLRAGMKKTDRTKLREWVAKLPQRKGRLGGALRGPERAALEAIAKLKAQPHSGQVFSTVEIARGAGLLVKATFDALRALEARGGYVSGVASGDLDRWGRPVESVWWQSGEAMGVDQAPVLDAVVSVRGELALLRVEPLAVGIIEKACRRTAGWSPAALRFPQGEFSETYDVSGQGAIEWLRPRWPVAL